jgi:hypothetical protein
MHISYPGSSSVLTVPRLTIDGDLSGDIVRWQAARADQYEFDVRINANQTITSPWQTTYETKVTRQCFKTSVDVKVDTSRIITDTHYELRYTAVGINSYPITRGNWFDASFVRPDVPLINGIDVSGDTFFGPAGSLHLIPVNILVIYKPTITLTISVERYKEQFGAYADTKIDWLDIFGFRFQVGANKKLEPIANPNGTVSVTFACPDNPVPQIVGVTSLLRYNGH